MFPLGYCIWLVDEQKGSPVALGQSPTGRGWQHIPWSVPRWGWCSAVTAPSPSPFSLYHSHTPAQAKWLAPNFSALVRSNTRENYDLPGGPQHCWLVALTVKKE